MTQIKYNEAKKTYIVVPSDLWDKKLS